MQTTKDQNQKNDQVKEKKIQEIFEYLLRSQKGHTAKEIAEKIQIKDIRLVRGLTRMAIKRAERKKYYTSRERINGSAAKLYNIYAEAPKGKNLPQKEKMKTT